MAKVALLLIVGIFAVYYFPDSRLMLLDATEPLVYQSSNRVPWKRWSASGGM